MTDDNTSASPRTGDEIASLALYRLRNWVATAEARFAKIQDLQQQASDQADQLTYALLEAREERDRLLVMGVSGPEIDAVAIVPDSLIPDLTVIVKAARRDAEQTQTQERLKEMLIDVNSSHEHRLSDNKAADGGHD